MSEHDIFVEFGLPAGHGEDIDASEDLDEDDYRYDDYGDTTNLYDETIAVLKHYGKTEKDVLWVGTRDQQFAFGTLKSIFDVTYDSGYGGAEVNMSMVVVGSDWWLERHEYDGSEWWEFKTMPKVPDSIITPRKYYDILR